MRREIIAVLQGRIAAGAGGLQDHSVYGQPFGGSGETGSAKPKRAPRKKKEVVPVPVPVPVVVEMEVEAAGKRKRKAKKMVEVAVPVPVANTQLAPPTGAAKKVRAGNKWVDHVMAYKNKHNVSYNQAMKDSKASYKK